MSSNAIFPVKSQIIFVLLLLYLQCFTTEVIQKMSSEEKAQLRDTAKDMFYHAFNAYMENAYPADELMPLSCKGRYRGLAPNRGDIDECLGNFSLTLVDAMDTLVILGDVNKFEEAVKLVIQDVSFDSDIVVSVFETNIRMLGGLLSAHVLSEYLQENEGVMQWYNGELLEMSKDLGYRLLPAFNTTTGIPYSRVNLLYGIKSDGLDAARETCTACAGSMILEMAALSRLTKDPIFEEKAHKAMDQLWKMRHRSSDLMGSVLNVNSGDWVRRDSGVGAGIDSYYEYCLKAYILLGDVKYLNRFNRHYNAIMKYISQGPMLLDVHMHRPYTNSKNFMDALLAFWPGLQVLKGDIKPAIETHEMLYQVMQRHKFIPEAFTTDFQVHWGNHPLRPEFLESTYYLYEATKDPYYLDVGKKVLETLQKYAKVPCGYAAVNDVRTTRQEDRMDSFVLSETFKYLYLLFAEPQDLILNLNEFIFTTEGHLLPLTLGLENRTKSLLETEVDEFKYSRQCPNTFQLYPENLRKPLKNMVDGMCPSSGRFKKRLTASEFSASNINHLKIINDMGITFVALNDGRVQLLHSFSSARTPADAENGLVFMQEMIELSKLQSTLPETLAQSILFEVADEGGATKRTVSINACPAQFGVNLKGDKAVSSETVIVHPYTACENLENAEEIQGKIALLERGECMFIDKARNVQKAGGLGAIIIDNVQGSSAQTTPMFSMSGDGNDDVNIPVVFLYSQDASKLLETLSIAPKTVVSIKQSKGGAMNANFEKNSEESMFQKLKVSVQEFLNKHTGLSLKKTVTVGRFSAEFSENDEMVKITLKEKSDDETTPSDEFLETKTDEHWSKIRSNLLRLAISEHELNISMKILKIYYGTLSGFSSDKSKESGGVQKQVTWLLGELMKELNRKKDDSFIVLEKTNEISGVIEGENKETLSQVLESMSQLEKNIQDKNKNMLNDLIKNFNDQTENQEEILKNEKSRT